MLILQLMNIKVPFYCTSNTIKMMFERHSSTNMCVLCYCRGCTRALMYLNGQLHQLWRQTALLHTTTATHTDIVRCTYMLFIYVQFQTDNLSVSSAIWRAFDPCVCVIE